jgi:folate-dependent tRNA-U54 methylase TrmFO/GidA
MNASAKRFQPMNVNYGLFPALPAERVLPTGSEDRGRRGRRRKLPKRERNERIAKRAIESFDGYVGRVAAEPA